MTLVLAKLILTVAFAAVFISHASANTNILVVILDDVNDYIGAMGGHVQAHTPNMDTFLAENIHFEVATPAGVVCLPARTAILTGLSPATTDVWNNGDQAVWEALDVVTLPEVFEAAGYTTTSIGRVFHQHSDALDRVTIPQPAAVNPQSVNNLSGFPVTDEQFDWSQFPINEQMGDYKRVELLRTFLDDRAADENWLAMVGLSAAHKPFYCPDHFPLTVGDTWFPKILPQDQTDIPASGQREDVTVYPDLEAYGNFAKRNAVHGYMNCVSYQDYEFGRILDVLADSDYEDNTIVVLVSDHGYSMGEKQYYGKQTLFQETTDIVFGMRIPGRVGQVIDLPVNAAAILPTLAELAGLPEPDSDYRSLVPLLDGENWAGAAVSFDIEQDVMLRAARYTYIFTGENLTDVQVYDQQTDPHEWVNIADTHDPVKVTNKRNKAMNILNGTNGKL